MHIDEDNYVQWIIIAGFLILAAVVFRSRSQENSDTNTADELEDYSDEEIVDLSLNPLQGPFPKRDEEKIVEACKELGLEHEIFFDEKSFQNAVDAMAANPVAYNAFRTQSFDPGVLFVKLGTEDPELIQEFRGRLGLHL